MNSTPNYGFDKQVQIGAIENIDRELKRMEDLIRCHAGSGCGCSSKVDRCEFDRHLTDPAAHRELLEQKVDKQEGHGLISNGCLEQIGANRNDISLLEQSILELREQNRLLQQELAGKADACPPILHPIIYTDGYQAHDSGDGAERLSYYSKTQGGLVVISFAAKRSGNKAFDEFINPLAILPEGFRPSAAVYDTGSGTDSNNIVRFFNGIRVNETGELLVHVPHEFLNETYYIRGSISYIATR